MWKRHLPINRYFWRFCGLLLLFLWLCVGSSKFFACPLKRIVPMSSLPSQKKSLCVKILSACSPSKIKIKFLYAWILPFIYKAAYSLWNILFPFFFLRVRGYGKPIMCGSLGDFPKDATVSCLVSDQIPFNLLSIWSRIPS